MKRFERDWFDLHQMDCIDLLKETPDGFYDLAIVDPEYGIKINNNIGRRKGDKHSGHKKVEWDNDIPSDLYFSEVFRASKNQIIWGANYFPFVWSSGCKCFLIWDKKFSNDVSFSRYEFAWTSFNQTSKGFDYSPSNQKNKIHPTQKPVQLYKWILKNYAKPNDKILDTHIGSGSIVLAVNDVNKKDNMNLHITGTELDHDYFTDMIKRIQENTLQMSIFE